MDIFAAIAQTEEQKRADIFEVVPEKLEEIALPLKPASGEKTNFELLYDKEGLARKLAEQREKYAAFLQDLASECAEQRKKRFLTKFVLDGEEKVTLPHYGGPTGYARKVYETQWPNLE